MNALAYAGTTSRLRGRVDRPLAQLYAQEAELRFARVRLNEQIDSVSLHGDEEGEKEHLNNELKGVLRIMWRIVAAATPLKLKATFENLEFATPTGCTMLGEQYVEIAVGVRVLIVGARETGKTLLFRAIAGCGRGPQLSPTIGVSSSLRSHEICLR